MGEAGGRLGEKAPVGLQIFDGLAPVLLQVADGVGPVTLTPVVEDAKKAVLRSEDGKGIISQKLAAADLGQSLHGQQRDSQGCFAGRTEEGLEAARDLRPERHQQADLTACDGERDRFHRGLGLENFRHASTVGIAVNLVIRHCTRTTNSRELCEGTRQLDTVTIIAIFLNTTCICVTAIKFIIAQCNMLCQRKILIIYLGFLILLHLEFPLQNANGGANAQERRVKGQTAGFSLITVIIAQRTRFVNVFLQKMQLFPRLRPEFPYVSR